MRRKLALLALAAWLVGGTALGGLLLARHLVALPVPDRADPALAAAIREALPPSGRRLRAIHVLYRDCACSRRTIAHLIERRALAGVDELVLAIDDAGRAGPADAALRAAGFAVRVVTPTELRARLGLEAAPVLIVARPDGELAYVGGYNRHKQTRSEDVELLAELGRGADAPALPVFGCPTSARLASALDPLGLARASEDLAR